MRLYEIYIDNKYATTKGESPYYVEILACKPPTAELPSTNYILEIRHKNTNKLIYEAAGSRWEHRNDTEIIGTVIKGNDWEPYTPKGEIPK